MQFSSVVLTILAATGAIALPQNMGGKDINVLLQGDNVDAWLAVGFKEDVKGTATTDKPRKFTTAKLTLGKDIVNKDLRCKLLNEDGGHVVVTRGENIDTTLGDGGKGPWTLKTPTVIKSVVCDKDFKKVDPADVNIVRVILSDGRETGAQVTLNAMEAGQKTTKQPSQDGPFNQVTLQVGPGIAKQALRCQILDNMNKPIKLQRGAAKDITFGDAGKGAWTFQSGNAKVEKIVCDPTFVKAAA